MLLPRRIITLLMECPFKALQRVPGDAQPARLLATPRKPSRARTHTRDIWGARQDEFVAMLFCPHSGLKEIRGQVGGGDAAHPSAAPAYRQAAPLLSMSPPADEVPAGGNMIGRLVRRKFSGSSKRYIGRVIRETETGWSVAYEDGELHHEPLATVEKNSQDYNNWLSSKAKLQAPWPPLEAQRARLGVVETATAGGGDCLINATHRPLVRPQADEELAHPCPLDTRSTLAARLTASQFQLWCGVTDPEREAALLALNQPGAALGGIAVKLLALRLKRHIVVLNWAHGAAGIFTPIPSLPPEWYGRADGAIIAPSLDWLVAWQLGRKRKSMGLSLKAPREQPIIISYNLEEQHFTAELLPGQVVPTPPPTPPCSPSPETTPPEQASPVAAPPGQPPVGSAGKSPAEQRRERRSIVEIPADYPPLRVEQADGKTFYYCPFSTCVRGKPGARGYTSKGAAETHMKEHVLRGDDAQTAARNGSQPSTGHGPRAKPSLRIPAESWLQLDWPR